MKSTRIPVRRDYPRDPMLPCFADDRDPTPETPRQARPAGAPERRPGFFPIVKAGVRYELRLDDDPNHPGLDGDIRRVFDFYAVGTEIPEARVVTYPAGPQCRCPEFERWGDCDHLAALIEDRRIPNVRVPETEGGHG